MVATRVTRGQTTMYTNNEDLTAGEFMLRCAVMANSPPDNDALFWVWVNFTWRAITLLTFNTQKRKELENEPTREYFDCEALAMKMIYEAWKDELKVTSPEQFDLACLGMWDRKAAEIISMKRGSSE